MKLSLYSFVVLFFGFVFVFVWFWFFLGGVLAFYFSYFYLWFVLIGPAPMNLTFMGAGMLTSVL